jgi:hypothetical protein
MVCFLTIHTKKSAGVAGRNAFGVSRVTHAYATCLSRDAVSMMGLLTLGSNGLGARFYRQVTGWRKSNNENQYGNQQKNEMDAGNDRRGDFACFRDRLR